jgi:hypothetical protein
MEFIFLLFVIPILFAGYKWVYEPFEDGTRRIDPLKRPTLARVQRILRAKNTKAREIEMKILERDRQKSLTKELEASKEKHEKRMYEDQTKHANAISQWETELAEITREEDERKAAEAQQARMLALSRQKALEADQRKRELEIWTANEKIRLEKFKEQRALELEMERQERVSELARREKEYADKQRYWSKPSTDPELSYTQRRVGVHSVNLRKLPHTGTAKIGNLVQGEIVQVDGWLSSEEHHGNDIWFRTQFTQKRKDGYGYINRIAYIWSGSLTNTSTSGLENLNEDTDEFTQKNAYGETIYTYKAPRQIDIEIENYLKNAKVSEARQIMSKNTENALDVLTELHKKPKMLLTAPPKLDRISVNKITADKIYFHPEEMFRTMDGIRSGLDRLSGLSGPELDSLHSKIKSRFMNTKPDLTRETVDELNELAEANDAVESEKTRRDETIKTLEGAKFFINKDTEVMFGSIPKEYQPHGHYS